jgi:hypothetical protein
MRLLPTQFPTDTQLFRETQAAELLGCSIRSLQSWRQRGTGPAYIRLSPRAIRYSYGDLQKWLTSCNSGLKAKGV